jgi:hypothetical protein
MPNISFTQFSFHNDNGVGVVVSLDANGTSVIQNQSVAPKGSFTESLKLTMSKRSKYL